MSESEKQYCLHNLKIIVLEAILYITNHIINCIPFHFIRLGFYRVFLKFEIGKDSIIAMGNLFDAYKNFKLGNNSIINSKCRLDNRDSLTIGENVSIASEVCILTGDHDLHRSDMAGRTRSVNIEDYVFIGTRAMILPGVTLGKGCAVAAGAVVTKSVLPFTIVAGVPAKPIGKRPIDLQYCLSYRRWFY